jgi:hypothetical protein
VPEDEVEGNIRESDRLSEVLLTLVRYLVDRPEALRVNVIQHDSAALYELKVAPEDVGRVIGRQGRVIRALRAVLRSLGARDGKRVELELLE